MNLRKLFRKRTEYRGDSGYDAPYDQGKEAAQEAAYQFCVRCDANLTLQRGYRNDLPYWVCKGCGEMLINPASPDESGIVWLCDRCGAFLNAQEGFADADHAANGNAWVCKECGYSNPMDEGSVYPTEDAYQAELRNPYHGLSDEAILSLSTYEEVTGIDHRDDILLVRSLEDEQLYVKKILTTYDASVYAYLMEHPIAHMPRIYGTYEGEHHLIVMEEYIEGRTLAHELEGGVMSSKKAAEIGLALCEILKDLHGLPQPMVHRDIKPSNVMLQPDGQVILLDLNAAKWFRPDETEDTRLLGTQYYAAPEQLGYGFAASSAKSDIYALGMLLNVMTTGTYPKESKGPADIWPIIERCIRLNPEERYDDTELMDALQLLCKSNG